MSVKGTAIKNCVNKFVKEEMVMGIIDLIMGWGVLAEEVSDVEFESLSKADKNFKKAN